MFDQLTNWTECTCCYRNFEHREGFILSRQSFTVFFFLEISPIPILLIGKKVMK